MLTAPVILTAVISTIGFFLNCGMLYLVLSKGRKTYHYLFSAILFICALWDLGILLCMVRNSHERELIIYGYFVFLPCCFLAALIYLFTTTYLQQPKKKTTIFLWVFSILGFIGIATGVAGKIDGVFHYSWGNIYRPDRTLQYVALSFIPGFSFAILSSAWMLFRASQRETSPIRKRHMIYMAISLVAMTLASIKLSVLYNVDNALLLPAGMFVNDVFSAVIAIAIVRHQYLEINLVINRSLVYGSISVILMGVFGGSLLLLSQFFGDNANAAMLSTAVTAGVFGFTFRPLQRGLQRFVDRRFFNIQIDYLRTPAPTASIHSGELQKDLGLYTNLKFIGRGGMAIVYRASHPDHKKPVAIKIMPAELASNPEFRRRFEREARVITNLKHPNIIKIHEFGETNGIPFIAMEYFPGQDLSFYLQKIGHVPVEDTVNLVDQIGSALDYAHQRGIVHRDIKPSNIMLDLSGQKQKAILMDFGIAKLLEAATMITQSGFVGTLDYIAPEQIQASSEVDRRADIYALGVLTYQMLTGELPYKHSNAGALLMAHLSQEPPDPRDILPGMSIHIVKAIWQAMEKIPEKRFETAGLFSIALTGSN